MWRASRPATFAYYRLLTQADFLEEAERARMDEFVGHSVADDHFRPQTTSGGVGEQMKLLMILHITLLKLVMVLEHGKS